VVYFLLSCGLAFQLPTVLIILVRLRILNSTILRKQRRIAYFALFAFAEIITPVSDPIVAPLTVMVPLVILYEFSILAAQRIEAGREKDLQVDTTPQKL
jgi:sec-independent protein translocase protein TatC